MENFSVLMSLYYKEKPEYFCRCMDSVLSQTVLPSQIVIVKDGPLTEELEQVIDSYVNKNIDLYTVVALEKNQGLGAALANGIIHCKYELIARMDTDDISLPYRFEKQLKMFEENSDLDICGSHIIEFEGSTSNEVSRRYVPIDDHSIKSYQKKRDAFNHMTVMYKKSTVLKAGNYQSCLLMEDTLLWVNMIKVGARCANIDEPLVYARVGADMYKRRGGWSYFLKYKNGRKKVYDTGYISSIDYLYSLFAQLIVAILPNNFRKYVFKNVLRSKVGR